MAIKTFALLLLKSGLDVGFLLLPASTTTPNTPF